MVVSKSCLSCQGLSSVLWSASEELNKKVWERAWLRQMAQSSQVIFHTADHLIQYINWGKLPCRGQLLFGDWLSWWWKLYCSSLVSLSSLSLPPFFIAFTINYYYNLHHHPSSPHHHHLCFVLLFLIIKLFVSWPMSFTLFLILLPIPPWRKWSE